jgi:hypothetical protein
LHQWKQVVTGCSAFKLLIDIYAKSTATDAIPDKTQDIGLSKQKVETEGL